MASWEKLLPMARIRRVSRRCAGKGKKRMKATKDRMIFFMEDMFTYTKISIFEKESLSLKNKLITIYEKNHRMRTQLQRGTR